MRIPNATLALTAALFTAALAQSVEQLSVTLAGKALLLESVTVDGKTFVSLEQLRKALPNPAPATLQQPINVTLNVRLGKLPAGTGDLEPVLTLKLKP